MTTTRGRVNLLERSAVPPKAGCWSNAGDVLMVIQSSRQAVDAQV